MEPLCRVGEAGRLLTLATVKDGGSSGAETRQKSDPSPSQRNPQSRFRLGLLCLRLPVFYSGVESTLKTMPPVHMDTHDDQQS